MRQSSVISRNNEEISRYKSHLLGYRGCKDGYTQD